MSTVEAEVVVGEALARLAVARGGVIDDIQTEVYMDALADLDPALVSRACQALGLEPRGEFDPLLPPVASIRSRVSLVALEDRAADARKRLAPMPSDEDRRAWTYCRVCRDSAWDESWCAGEPEQEPRPYPFLDEKLPAKLCGRSHEHPPHTWVRRCECIDRNPVIAKRREAEMKRQTAATGRRKGA